MFGEYSYSVGNIVQLVRDGKAWVVVWRGQVKVPHPMGGTVRANVYRLDNDY